MIPNDLSPASRWDPVADRAAQSQGAATDRIQSASPAAIPAPACLPGLARSLDHLAAAARRWGCAALGSWRSMRGENPTQAADRERSPRVHPSQPRPADYSPGEPDPTRLPEGHSEDLHVETTPLRHGRAWIAAAQPAQGFALWLLLLGSLIGPLRSGGAPLWAPLLDQHTRAHERLRSLGQRPGSPSPAARLARDPRVALTARELRSLPGIGAVRALEITAAQELVPGGLPWMAWASATSLGSVALQRLAAELQRRGEAPTSGERPP
jgi:hypothetical protein